MAFDLIQLTRPFNHEGGFCFKLSVEGLRHRRLQGSKPLVDIGNLELVLENGEPLGPGDMPHDTIRKTGGGAFSLWGDDLYFSASDNSDCNANGRVYSLVLIAFDQGTELYDRMCNRAAGDTEFLLRAIHASWSHNNSFFNNFFGYFNFLQDFLGRNGIAIPSKILEIGCGRRPYSALRLLTEGVEVCYVNDINPIDCSFSTPFMEHVESLLRTLDHQAPSRFSQRRVVQSQGSETMSGLKILGETPFELLNVSECIDLIWSVSVLEHVFNPEAVVEQMWRILPSGGHTCHWIDLRDHNNFGNPLGFLSLTEDQYADRKTENRLRSSQWKDLFDSQGFVPIEYQYETLKEVNSGERVYSIGTPATVRVTDEDRKAMASPFNSMGLDVLSTVSMGILCRKP